jgi:preprotein translocase subunit SecE
MKAAMLDNLKDASDSRLGWFGRARRFLADVRSELGRVTWPSRREVWATTLVVILTSTLFGVYLAIVDYGLTWLVSWLYARLG